MRISRRDFIKDSWKLIGGVAIGSMTLASACKQDPITTETTSSGSVQPTTSPTTTGNPPTSSVSTFSYVPSREGVELQLVPGCTSWVAMDRKYTLEHIWVKSIEEDKVVLGITDKMQLLMARIATLQLTAEGGNVTKDEAFGFAEGDKLSIDLMAPVSGTVIQVNHTIWATAGQNTGLELITSDPYFNGWMMVLQLSKPAELADLVIPEYYMMMNSKPVT
jgi:glycine cleavage system H protein